MSCILNSNPRLGQTLIGQIYHAWNKKHHILFPELTTGDLFVLGDYGLKRVDYKNLKPTKEVLVLDNCPEEVFSFLFDHGIKFGSLNPKNLLKKLEQGPAIIIGNFPPEFIPNPNDEYRLLSPIEYGRLVELRKDNENVVTLKAVYCLEWHPLFFETIADNFWTVIFYDDFKH